MPKVSSREFFTYTRLGREAVRRFGGIRAAIEQIGDVWAGRRSWPRLSADEVIARIQERHRAGRTLLGEPTRLEDPSLHSSAAKRFGSWGSAMRAAGLGALVGRSYPYDPPKGRAVLQRIRQERPA
jgi:hypothetical protein